MAKLSLTRRSFLKAAAVTGAASTLSFAAAPSAALAEGVDESAGEVKRIRSCCRACGKCECGVWVTVQDNKVIKVEGDESNAHSRGHCCAKSQASMLALYHPDRLRYTMKRTNPKGEDDPGWVRVNFAEAMDEIGAKYNELIAKYGGKSIFSMGGTSRVWAQPPYGTLKSVFGTHNFHSAYEICKGPRHFGGVLTDEKGSPWMEVEQGPIVYVQWGTASEYSNYDSTNRTVVDCSQRAYKHILVDPRMSPLGKEADLWLPIRVGTDLAMSLGWLKWIVDNDAYDKNFVKRWSNGPFLYNPEADGKTYKGYFLEMNGGIHMTSRLLTEADLDREWVSQFWEPAPEQYSYRRFICWDAANEKPTYWDAEECQWEGEKHKIPTTGTWIEHPYKPIIADAWLPDPSKFADPADPAYDAYWTGEGNEKGAKSNPKGLPKDPELWPDGVQVKLANGKMIEAKSVWQEWEHNLEEYTLERVSEITEVPADKIEEAVRTYTTRLNPLHGNGGIHFQLATDQNGNSIQNCRVLQMLSCVTGNSDEPAGNRGSCKSQFDGNPGRSNMQKAAPWGDKAKVWPGRDYSLEEVAKHMQDFVQYLIDENSPLAERYGNKVPSDEEAIVIAKRMGGAMLPSQGWPNPTTIFMRQAGQVDADRFPLNRFWARWADANCIWDACLQDPDWSLAMENENKEVGYNVKETLYALHGGVCQSGDIMNMGNIARAWDATTQLDFFVDINLWFCPNNGNADIIFPCQHWMELDSTRVSQGSGGMFGCCCAAIEPPGETIYDPDWNVGMYKAMGVPWNTKDPDAAPAQNLNYAPQCQTFIDKWTEQLGDDYDASGAPSYLWPDHDRVLKDNVDKWCTAEFPEGPTWAEAKQWFTDHGWMDCREWHPERWGTFRRHEMGWRRQQGGFNLFPLVDFHPGFMTASGLVEIWSLVCEAYICNMGEVPEDSDKWAHSDLPQFQGDDDRFPIYREPTDSPVAKPELYDAALVDQADDTYFMNHGYKDTLKAMPDNIFLMTTGSRQPTYFHSEHRQLPWCREVWPSPRIEMNPKDAERLGLKQGDWVWIETPWGKVREVLDLYYGISQGVVNANHAWWFPEFDTASHGFELVGINVVNDPYGQDTVGGCATMRSTPTIVYKATAENSPFGNPVPCDPNGVECIHDASDPRLKEWLPNYDIREEA